MAMVLGVEILVEVVEDEVIMFQTHKKGAAGTKERDNDDDRQKTKRRTSENGLLRCVHVGIPTNHATSLSLSVLLLTLLSVFFFSSLFNDTTATSLGSCRFSTKEQRRLLDVGLSFLSIIALLVHRQNRNVNPWWDCHS
mmetsp:Transcript_33779/g.50090  ORF Transcript_33779/g.50090 Transcript_33779/m.50090 type:complete len:139 (-) Transcript_33779:4763-5179(-)